MGEGDCVVLYIVISVLHIWDQLLIAANLPYPIWEGGRFGGWCARKSSYCLRNYEDEHAS